MGIIRDMQRVHARQTHDHQRAQAVTVRQRDQIRRNADLALAAAQQAVAAEDERERRRLYAEARAAEAENANAGLRGRLNELDTVLLSSLAVDDHIDLDRFKKPLVIPPFDPGPLGRPLPEPSWDSFAPPQPRGGLGRVVLGERHEKRVAAARQAFEDAKARHAEAEARRRRQLAERERAYRQNRDLLTARVTAYNAEVDRFAAAVAGGDPESVIEYFSMVLGNSVYPDDFPQHYRLAFVPGERHLVVEYQLPPVEVVPAVKEYRYDRARDEIRAVGRTGDEIRRRYLIVITQIALRTVHEIVEADRGGLVELVVFNGVVDTVDRRTGTPTRPCLISLRAPRPDFAAIDLRHVDPVACARHLDARVSEQPDELAGVRPVVDFDMVDGTYSDDVDVLADLDRRPNLLALPSDDFEGVVGDLFTVMGLQMGYARPDGDVAAWSAVDPRPLFGGRVVVHATRADRVGPAAVRALADAVATAGATKGILVTTGVFEPGVHTQDGGRPLELIDGAGLLTLLADHSRLRARIAPV
jgi:restriction system protein